MCYTTPTRLATHAARGCAQCATCHRWCGCQESATPGRNEDKGVCLPRDNPLRRTAVEHAVKLIVEGRVASMATSRDKRAASRHERYEARVAASLNVARRFGWARGKISADLDPEVRDLLVDLFAERRGLKSAQVIGGRSVGVAIPQQRRRWQPPLLICPATEPSWHQERARSGKAMIAACRGAAEPGGWRSTRRRCTAAEGEAISEQLAVA